MSAIDLQFGQPDKPRAIKKRLKEVASEGNTIKCLTFNNCHLTTAVWKCLLQTERLVKRTEEQLVIKIDKPEKLRLFPKVDPEPQRPPNNPPSFDDPTFELWQWLSGAHEEWEQKEKPLHTVLAIDAALQGADEVAFAIVSMYSGCKLIVHETGAFPKGEGESGADNKVLDLILEKARSCVEVFGSVVVFSEPYPIGVLYIRLLEERYRWYVAQNPHFPLVKCFTCHKMGLFHCHNPLNSFPFGWPKLTLIKAVLSRAQSYWGSVVFIASDEKLKQQIEALYANTRMDHDDRVDALSLALFALTPIPLKEFTRQQEVEEIEMTNCTFQEKDLDLLLQFAEPPNLSITPDPEGLSEGVQKLLV